MPIQPLRAAHKATPFRPFKVHVAEGRQFAVPHPDFLSLSPSAETLIIDPDDDKTSILDLLLMTDVEMTSSHASRS